VLHRNVGRLGTALALALAIAVTTTACGSSGSGGRADGGSVPTLSVPGSVGPPATNPATSGTGQGLPNGVAAVTVLGNDLGDILVDGRTGHTLYAYLGDGKDHPTCVGACAQVWAPFTGTQIGLGPSVTYKPGEFKLVARPGGGARQLSVNGRPLYTYAGDTLAGQTKGQGVQGRWFVVSPDGTPITKTS
jgi:predicted lipoprotein with Yx(FWY)xxD motif